MLHNSGISGAIGRLQRAKRDAAACQAAERGSRERGVEFDGGEVAFTDGQTVGAARAAKVAAP
ncbi:hypothetical protein C1I92_22185 [Jiangella anatolica]|uniref:Uncharacterized protein n=1 Tax=Jiangella anatolica TaxID=2670374 RepID=A0A2W2BYU8_9ACTN|nr:hypothetical protein C1I92_22185 [Jiangella anatolica]